MDIRQRILAAAKEVYAVHGFRGATTRLIAIQAGVNEVTLFRTFGSKAALFEALMQEHAAKSPVPDLPDHPVDPEAEMTHWCAGILAYLRANRGLIRASFGEIEERPESAISMCQGPSCAGMMLADYVQRLQAMGFAAADADIQTAVAMFVSGIIGDALRRDVMPHAFPPVDEAPTRYVRIFMRSLGVEVARRPAPLRTAAGD